MIACLGMYDMPSTRAATERLWTEIAARLLDAPPTLTRDMAPADTWLRPDLLLGQTCGYPYRARLTGKVTLVATPDHGLPDCPPGHYYSVIVARADDGRQQLADFDGARLAYNEALSQSGWAGPMHHLRMQDVTPGTVVATGAHRRSAETVTAGDADFAGLDAVTWAMMRAADDPAATGLRVLAQTAPRPALPYITALGNDPRPIETALRGAIEALPAPLRSVLHLHGTVRLSPDEYVAVPTPPGPGTYRQT